MPISGLALSILIRILLSGYFVLASLWDLSIQRGRVPNWLTLPPLAFVGIGRLYQRRWEVLISWTVLFLIWRFHLFGGGDAKLLMMEGALFPTCEFAVLSALSILLVAGSVLIVRSWRKGELLALGRRLAARFITLQLFPSEEEFRTEAEPSTYLFCIGPMLYAWLLW